MIERRTLCLASGFAAGLLLTGVPYWRLPYNANFFADPLVLAGFAGLGVVTAVLAASCVARLPQVFWVTLAAFPAAMAIRVVVETAQDPTDHNLWPFELILAALFSLVAIVPGLLVGALARRLGR
jgi:hypothetical protein